MTGPQTVKIDREVLDDLEAALQPLVNIADAFYRNELDPPARFWAGNEESPQFNTTDPKDVELYTKGWGDPLLTLKDVLNAKRAIIMLKAQFEGVCRG